MSVDRPGGGDGFPDRRPEDGDRPFPGAPEDREPAEEPGSTFSMEEFGELYRRAGTSAELAAMETAYTPGEVDVSVPGPGAGQPDGDSGADSGYPGHDTGSPADAGVANADGAGNGNWDPPAEPAGDAGAALDDGAPGDEDGRFTGWPDAAPAAPAAGDREAAAGRQEIDGAHGFLGPTGDLQDQGAAEVGEPESGERPGPGTRASADTSQQAERGEEGRGETDGEGQGEDGQDQKPRDLVQVQHPAPEAETGRPGEAASEAAPDQQPDDPRWAAVFSVIESVQAENQELKQQVEATATKLDELETQHEKDQARISELEARLEASPDRDPDDAQSDQARAERRADRPPQGLQDSDQVVDDLRIEDESQDASRAERKNVDQASDSNNAEPSRWRRLLTSDRVGAAGTVATAVNSAAMFATHASPEGMVSLGMAILGVAGLGLARAEKRRKEKNERQD